MEAENPKLKGILDKRFARAQLPDGKLGKLVDLVSTIGFGASAALAGDVLGQVYECFLGRFVQSEEFILSHGGKLGDVAIFGREANPTKWRLAAMNLAREPAGTFTHDQFPGLRADFILANPPFNISDWWRAGLTGDARWHYGDPPAGNANHAWLQHMLFHLKPGGRAGIVLANGSMSSSQNNEGQVRAAMVDTDGVEVMIALPGQLFFYTQIPACLWFLAKDKRTRRGEVLFIDARKLAVMISRVQCELTDEVLARIAATVSARRADESLPLPPGGQG